MVRRSVSSSKSDFLIVVETALKVACVCETAQLALWGLGSFCVVSSLKVWNPSVML